MNIGKADTTEDWRLREAATFAFGSILDGPPADKLAGLVAMGLPFLLNALKDQHTAVRHTTAWTIGAGRRLVCIASESETACTDEHGRMDSLHVCIPAPPAGGWRFGLPHVPHSGGSNTCLSMTVEC